MAEIITDFMDRRVAQMDADAAAKAKRRRMQEIADKMRPPGKSLVHLPIGPVKED